MSAIEPSFEPRPSEEQPGSAEARAATRPEHFDVLILGSGQGGKLLAWTTSTSPSMTLRSPPSRAARTVSSLSPAVTPRSSR